MSEEVAMNGAVWTGWRAARDTLREWRESNTRMSDRTVDLGRKLLDGYSSRLGSEGGQLTYSAVALTDTNLIHQCGPSTSKCVPRHWTVGIFTLHR